jgi:hypothetical protein
LKYKEYDNYNIKFKLKKCQLEANYYSLCFAFALVENRSVKTKFEKDNPVVGAPEVFVHYSDFLSPNSGIIQIKK